MYDFFTKNLPTVIAGVLGWFFFGITRLERGNITMRRLLSSLGLAALIGYVTGALCIWLAPSVPFEVVCSLSSMTGAMCDQVMNRVSIFGGRITDRVEQKILDNIYDNKEDNEDEPDSKKADQ